MEFFPATYADEARSGESVVGSVFLPDWSASKWDNLLEHTQAQMFSPGDIVVRAGANERALYIVAFGRLVSFVNTKKRLPFRVASGRASPLITDVESGSVINTLTFLDGESSVATIQARTECQLLYLSFDSFSVFAARHPELGREVLLDLGRLMAGQVRRMSSLLASYRGNK